MAWRQQPPHRCRTRWLRSGRSRSWRRPNLQRWRALRHRGHAPYPRPRLDLRVLLARDHERRRVLSHPDRLRAGNRNLRILVFRAFTPMPRLEEQKLVSQLDAVAGRHVYDQVVLQSGQNRRAVYELDLRHDRIRGRLGTSEDVHRRAVVWHQPLVGEDLAKHASHLCDGRLPIARRTRHLDDTRWHDDLTEVLDIGTERVGDVSVAFRGGRAGGWGDEQIIMKLRADLVLRPRERDGQVDDLLNAPGAARTTRAVDERCRDEGAERDRWH